MRSGWLVVSAACLLYLAFLPSAIVNADEIHYAGQAYAIARGRLVPSSTDPVAVSSGHERQGTRFPPGWPLVLALARPLGFRAMYLVPMLLHLAAGMAFARLAVRRGVPAWTNALYVFHPVLWGLSRTIMSDVPAVALVVMAIDGWEARRSWLPGSLLACGSLLRMGGVISAAGFGLASFGEWRRQPRRLVALISPLVVAAAFQAVLNRITTGHFQGIYAERGVELLDGSRAGGQLLLYVAGLALIPPFPLLGLLARPRLSDRWSLGAIPVLAFFVAYAYHDESQRLLETFLGGQRLVVAASAFLAVGTLRTWGGAAERLRIPVLVGAFAAAIAASVGLDRIREPYERAALAVASCHPRRVGYDYDAGKVVAALDATRWRALDGTDPQGQDDVVVISRRAATNRVSDPPARPRPAELEPHLSRCQRVGRFEIYDFAGRCGHVGEPCR